MDNKTRTTHDVHWTSFWSRVPNEALSVGDHMEIIFYKPMGTLLGIRKSLQ